MKKFFGWLMAMAIIFLFAICTCIPEKISGTFMVCYIVGMVILGIAGIAYAILISIENE
jgi:hypothetical protein